MKKEKSKYKILKEEEVHELMGMTDEDLYIELYKAKRNEVAAKRVKKTDPEIEKMKEEIKTFVNANMPDELLKEIEKVNNDKQQTMKEIKADDEIADTVMDLKLAQSEHNDTIKAFTEKQNAIMEIMQSRNALLKR